MTDPWNRNEGKFDRPSSAVPKTPVSVKVVGTSPLATAVRGEIERLEREALRGVEPITAEPVEDVEEVGGIEETTHSAAMLRNFVERVERINSEIEELQHDRKDVLSEAKSQGFDGPTIRKVIARRKLTLAEREEADGLLATYEAALGMSHAAAIDGGELKALPAPGAPPREGAKGKAVQEALAWASGGF